MAPPDLFLGTAVGSLPDTDTDTAGAVVTAFARRMGPPQNLRRRAYGNLCWLAPILKTPLTPTAIGGLVLADRF